MSPPTSPDKRLLATPDRRPRAAYDERTAEVLTFEEIGFARLELKRLTEWPWLEILIKANECDIEQEEIEALLNFVSEVLYSDKARDGFGLTYDFRMLKNPSVSGLLAIARWSAEPERKELFETCCIACKTCVPSGWKYFATKAAMSAFFGINPPTCKTYLMTDFDDPDASSHCWFPRGHPKDDREDSASNNSICSSPQKEAGVLQRERLQEASKSQPTSCWPFFCCRRSGRRKPPTFEEHQQALRRIDQLEESNQILVAMFEKMQQKVTLLEEAVPWVAVTQQFNDMGKTMTDWANGMSHSPR